MLLFIEIYIRGDGGGFWGWLLYKDFTDREVLPKFIRKTGKMEDISEYRTYKVYN